jgi:hypothetical protein
MRNESFKVILYALQKRYKRQLEVEEGNVNSFFGPLYLMTNERLYGHEPH